MKTVSFKSVRAISRGGAIETVFVTGVDGKSLLCRWKNRTPCEFSLTHGAIRSSPQWDWKWKLDPGDLENLREECGLKGPPSPVPEKAHRLGKEALAESRDGNQTTLLD